MERARALDLRPLLALLALGLVVTAVWAATALATGGSSDSEPSGGSGSGQPSLVQDDGGGGTDREDCPERDGGAGEEPQDSSGI